MGAPSMKKTCRCVSSSYLVRPADLASRNKGFVKSVPQSTHQAHRSHTAPRRPLPGADMFGFVGMMEGIDIGDESNFSYELPFDVLGERYVLCMLFKWGSWLVEYTIGTGVLSSDSLEARPHDKQITITSRLIRSSTKHQSMEAALKFLEPILFLSIDQHFLRDLLV